MGNEKQAGSSSSQLAGNGRSLQDRDQQRENVYLFTPNLIGYLRIVLAAGSLFETSLHPRTCSLFYGISCLLDAFDGYEARYFDQSTLFGVMLDMVTDRCTTACLLVFLASAFPRWIMVFQGLIALDMASHYTHMFATSALGDKNHKSVDKSQSWILNLYYTNKLVLFMLCALNEGFFVALYLLSFSSPLLSPLPTTQNLNSTAPYTELSSRETILANPHSAAAFELRRANKMDSTIPWIVAGLTCPFMILKQIINIVQLFEANKRLVKEDLKARRERGLPRGKKVS